MHEYLRKSIWTKAAALGFIGLVVMCNIKFVWFLTGEKSAVLIDLGFSFCIIWTMLAGCGMALKILVTKMKKSSNDDPPI